MASVDVAGREFNYVRGGGGEPLLLIQGMSATHLAWGRPFSSLLEESFGCIAFDNRGMGLSAPVAEPFTIADLAADALGLLDALEIERAHVLGISMGGMVAQELALGHPDRLRSLTLGATYCGGPEGQLMDPADFQELVAAMASGDRERVFRAMWELNLSPTFRQDESRYRAFTEMAEALPAPRETIGFQLQAIAEHDTSARLPGLSTPTLVIHGTEDRFLGVANGRLIASLIPARLELLDGVGHMFWWEQPERSAALIRNHALAPA
ncbi:MAG TPA: alpha/beta hydrolase [Solirubrobacterales bacterium]|jgi:Predicted hydrolases or acyltransferases (alpha/beta hydrolase superfamily)|nr:alpha/beta hydrolase [Solirubrobacterales bacterium]